MDERSDTLKALFEKAEDNRDAFWADRGLIAYEMPEYEEYDLGEPSILARGLAFILDVLCCAGMIAPFWYVKDQYWFLVAASACIYVYFVMIPFRLRATLGKRMFGIEIVSTKPGGVTHFQLFKREILAKLLAGFATRGIIFLWPGFANRLSGTQVRKVSRRAVWMLALCLGLATNATFAHPGEDPLPKIEHPALNEKLAKELAAWMKYNEKSLAAFDRQKPEVQHKLTTDLRYYLPAGAKFALKDRPVLTPIIPVAGRAHWGGQFLILKKDPTKNDDYGHFIFDSATLETSKIFQGARAVHVPMKSGKLALRTDRPAELFIGTKKFLVISTSDETIEVREELRPPLVLKFDSKTKTWGDPEPKP